MKKVNYELATSSWDEREIAAINEVLESGSFTMGEKVQEFEAKFATFIGTKYALMVNSGSSANLLMISALKYRKSSRLEPGDEIIVPSVSWSTTYYPVQQLGFVLKFVDIDPQTLNIDFQTLERAISPKTKAIFAVNLLGNPCEFDLLEEFCKRHDLILIEDNCESLGAEYYGKKTGSFGLAGTHSFFFSHHICTMEGGMVTTNNLELYETMVSLRAHGWVRGLPEVNSVSNLTGNDWDNMFKFVLPGYNFRPIEIEAAAGIVQLEKLPGFIEIRRRNAQYFVQRFSNLNYVRIQKEVGQSSWFGFALILDPDGPFRREDLIRVLDEAKIQSRPIVAGNFLLNPVVDHLPHVVHGDMRYANEIHTNGFFVGNSHLDLRSQIDFLYLRIKSYVEGI